MPKAAPYTASNGFAVSINQHALRSSPGTGGLPASAMAAVEREAGVRLKTCRTIRRVFRHTMSWVTLTVR